MQVLLQFIKDWIPSIGVIVAGLWVFFKWLHDENLRRKEDTPSLDGKLTATYISIEENKTLVTIEALWNNRSPLPIYMDINKCKIDIYEIPHNLNLENQCLTLKSDLGDPICSDKFLLHMVEVNYYFEPNSESTIINHFILANGIYGIRMVLHSGKKGQMWWKEIILNIQDQI